MEILKFEGWFYDHHQLQSVEGLRLDDKDTQKSAHSQMYLLWKCRSSVVEVQNWTDVGLEQNKVKTVKINEQNKMKMTEMKSETKQEENKRTVKSLKWPAKLDSKV